jgi:hypothetical protein
LATALRAPSPATATSAMTPAIGKSLVIKRMLKPPFWG